MGSFNDIFSEVKERLGGRTTIDSRITRWINDAYFDILMTPQYTFNEIDKIHSFPTVADQRIYTVLNDIADFWFILALRDETNEREIRKKDIKTFDRIAQTAGQPTRYARYGFNLHLDPTPNGVYNVSLRYRARTGELATSGMSILGREWDEAIVLLSAVKGYEGLEQPGKARDNMELYVALMGRREEQFRLEDEDKEPTIGPWLNEDLP